MGAIGTISGVNGKSAVATFALGVVAVSVQTGWVAVPSAVWPSNAGVGVVSIVQTWVAGAVAAGTWTMVVADSIVGVDSGRAIALGEASGGFAGRLGATALVVGLDDSVDGAACAATGAMQAIAVMVPIVVVSVAKRCIVYIRISLVSSIMLMCLVSLAQS